MVLVPSGHCDIGGIAVVAVSGHRGTGDIVVFVLPFGLVVSGHRGIRVLEVGLFRTLGIPRIGASWYLEVVDVSRSTL